MVLEFDNPATVSADQMFVSEKMLVMTVAVDESDLANKSGGGEQSQCSKNGGPADGLVAVLSEADIEFVGLEVARSGEDLFENCPSLGGEAKALVAKVLGKGVLFAHRNCPTQSRDWTTKHVEIASQSQCIIVFCDSGVKPRYS